METKKLYAIIVILLISLCAAVWVLFRTTSDYNAISGTVQQLETVNGEIKREVDNARQQINGASVNTAGAIIRIERSQKIVRGNATTIAECQELVSDIRAEVERTESIIADVKRTNQNAATQGTSKPD